MLCFNNTAAIGRHRNMSSAIHFQDEMGLSSNEDVNGAAHVSATTKCEGYYSLVGCLCNRLHSLRLLMEILWDQIIGSFSAQ